MTSANGVITRKNIAPSTIGLTTSAINNPNLSHAVFRSARTAGANNAIVRNAAVIAPAQIRTPPPPNTQGHSATAANTTAITNPKPRSLPRTNSSSRSSISCVFNRLSLLRPKIVTRVRLEFEALRRVLYHLLRQTPPHPLPRPVVYLIASDRTGVWRHVQNQQQCVAQLLRFLRAAPATKKALRGRLYTGPVT